MLVLVLVLVLVPEPALVRGLEPVREQQLSERGLLRHRIQRPL